MNWSIFKNRFRQRVVAGGARIWYSLGGSRWRVPGRRRYAEDCLLGQLRSLPPAPTTAVAPRPLRVVFHTMLGSHSFLTAMDIAWARALRLRGHNVSLVLCDQALPVCENKPFADRERWDALCDKCHQRGHALFEAARLPYDTVSTLAATPFDDAEEKFLRALDFSYIIDSTLYKYLRIGRLRGTAAEAEGREMARQACEISARAALALARQRPDRVVMSHGVYSTWAPALAVFNAKGIPVAVYNNGKRRNSAVLSWVPGFMNWEADAAWEQMKDVPLTPEQQARIGQYLGTRVKHTADALKYNFGDVETREQFFQRFRLDPAKPTFVLFTNVLWDAASAQKEIAFANAVDWVLETVAWFQEQPHLQLVVKIHPAEVVIGTNQPFAEEIRRAFPALPEHIRVIGPAEKINSWTMTTVATAALVHTSTPGMEMPLAGVPSIVVSKAHYRGKGFTIDVNSKEEYFRVIGEWRGSPIPVERMKTLALRYAWLLFERCHWPLEFLLESSFSRIWALNVAHDEELLNSPVLARLCECVELQSDFLFTDDAPAWPQRS